MPYNGSGTFVRLFNWTADAGNNLPISATKFDGEDNDFASGFGNCLTRDGQGAPTSPLTWTQPLTINVAADGTDLAVGRTGGANNPQLQVKLADATGATLNLSTAQQLALAINGTTYATLQSTSPNLTISSASSEVLRLVSSTGYLSFFNTANSTRSGYLQIEAATGSTLSVDVNQSLTLQTNSAARFVIAAAGNTTINAPGSGTALTVNSVAAGTALSMTDGTVTAVAGFGGTQWNIGTSSNHPMTLGTNNTVRASINAAGNVAINAPGSGNALTVNGVAGAQSNGAIAGYFIASSIPKVSLRDSTSGYDWSMYLSGGGVGAFTLRYEQGSLDVLSYSRGGNLTLGSPSSGTALTVPAGPGGISIGSPSNAGGYLDIGAASPVLRVQSTGANLAISELFATNTLVGIDANWGNNPTPFSIRMGGSSGTDCVNVSTSNEVGIATPSTIGNLIANTTQVGYMDTPQHNITANTTLALTDRGKSIYITGVTAAQTLTIPANASIAFPVGTTIIVVNNSNQNWSVAITTDVLEWLPSAATGTRTLAAGGVMTLYKDTATHWMNWGFGIT